MIQVSTVFLAVYIVVLIKTSEGHQKSRSSRKGSHSLNSFGQKQLNKKPPNIILLLADDLGYGDLSLKPFNALGIRTPEIEILAKEGLVMTK